MRCETYPTNSAATAGATLTASRVVNVAPVLSWRTAVHGSRDKKLRIPPKPRPQSACPSPERLIVEEFDAVLAEVDRILGLIEPRALDDA